MRSARKILERIVMILALNYDKIDFDALYKTQKAKSSFGKKLAEHWDKKASSLNEGVMKSAYARVYRQGRFYRALQRCLILHAEQAR